MIEGKISYSSVRDLLFDELGNDRHCYEIDVFDKFSDGTWQKVETKLSDRSNNIVLENENNEKKLYFRVDDSLIPLNMDFNSPSCHRCYSIAREVPVKHRVVSNETLLEVKSDFGGVYALRKQNYSDTPPFYYFTDPLGDFRVGHGNHDLVALIDKLKSSFKRDHSIYQALSEFKLPLAEVVKQAEAEKDVSGQKKENKLIER